MTQYDRISTIFWICIASGICIESLRIGPGSLSQPGPGLIPLASGLILGIFGIIVLVLSFKTKGEAGQLPWNSGIRWKKMVGIVGAIIAYALLIDFGGFYLVTFLWMVYLCWGIGEMGWKRAILVSLIGTLSSYLLFVYYLSINFPRGLLSF